METLKCIKEARQRGGKKVMAFTLGKYYQAMIFGNSIYIRDDNGKEEHFFDYTKLFKKVTQKEIDKEIGLLTKKIFNKVIDSGIKDLNIQVYLGGMIHITKYNGEDYDFYEHANCYDFYDANERIEKINELNEKLDKFIKQWKNKTI